MDMNQGLIDQIIQAIPMPHEILGYIIRSAPYRYKVFQIPKRGNKGFRTIAQPAREVKRLQYWVIENYLKKLPVHPAATAFKTSVNIRHNVYAHAKRPYLLKLDFTDFFPSIKSNDFRQYLDDKKYIDLSEMDVALLLRILFWRPKTDRDLVLSIGAPSSPLLSNIIMFDFDQLISEWCLHKTIQYTRYADDMSFSMYNKEQRQETLRFVEALVRELRYPRLSINENKTVFCSKASRRRVTGLIITNNATVSLGRERKRTIRSKVYQYKQGKLSHEEILSLKGMISFARSVEPAFVRALEKRYGSLRCTATTPSCTGQTH
jgi:RNA-directed DNA polymerase